MKGWVKLQLIDGTDEWVRPTAIVAIGHNDQGVYVKVALVVGTLGAYSVRGRPEDIQEAIDTAMDELTHRRLI